MPRSPVARPPACPLVRGRATRRAAWSGTAGTGPRRASGSGASGRTGSTGSCPRCHGVRPSRACATRATATCPHTVVRSPAASTTFPSGRSRPPSPRLGPARPTSVRRYAPAPRPAAGSWKATGAATRSLSGWTPAHPSLAENARTTWPETLVLDSTRFLVTNSWTGDTSVAFNVLGAYGYPAPGQGRPRVWALAAYHQATALEWEAFLRQLDTSTPPVLVISDGVDEIRNAVRRVWPAAADQPLAVPFVFRCEHHLRENARENLDADCVAHWGSVRMTALNDAFRSPDGWAAFKDTVWPKHANTYKWVKNNDAQVRAQVAARHQLPEHHSTAALDAHLGTVRDYLDSRSFVLRNQRRTTTMLGLVRLHLNGTDSPARYATALRTWLDTQGGTPPGQRGGYDAGTSRRLPAAERRTASLRG